VPEFEASGLSPRALVVAATLLGHALCAQMGARAHSRSAKVGSKKAVRVSWFYEIWNDSMAWDGVGSE